MYATTQDAYTALLRTHIGPALRSLGFKGSGGTYTADRPDAFVVLGFQRSRFGDRTHSEFTINLTVASIAAWNAAREAHPVLGPRPAPNGVHPENIFGTGAWQQRIGSVMPGDRDRWWSITPEANLDRLADEVMTAVRDFALPAIEERLRALGSRDIGAR